MQFLKTYFLREHLKLGERIQPLTTDTTSINNALGILLSYSLVKCELQECTISIYRLVQEELKARMDEQIRLEWAE
jgi:hypothetical protein